MGIIVQNLASSFESVESRHTDIQNHDVGLEVVNLLHGFAAIRSFAADFPSVMSREQSTDTATHNFMIIGHKNTERHKSPHTAANLCAESFCSS
jgi:hypothetical protein